MREIKFRVWDIKNKKFTAIRQDDVIPPEDDVMTIFEEGKNDYCFLQSTGLKDKNNKDIYEGDIVKFSYLIYDREWENEVGEVYFEDGIFYFSRSMSFAMNDCNFDYKSLEVIGNIFENPELIKKT